MVKKREILEKQIMIRVAKETYCKLETLSEKGYTTVSQYVRRLILENIKKEELEK